MVFPGVTGPAAKIGEASTVPDVMSVIPATTGESALEVMVAGRASAPMTNDAKKSTAAGNRPGTAATGMVLEGPTPEPAAKAMVITEAGAVGELRGGVRTRTAKAGAVVSVAGTIVGAPTAGMIAAGTEAVLVVVVMAGMIEAVTGVSMIGAGAAANSIVAAATMVIMMLAMPVGATTAGRAATNRPPNLLWTRMSPARRSRLRPGAIFVP